jgi:NAD+ synthase
MKKKETVDHIVKWLRQYCETSGMSGFVVGVSGGIDSALTSTLCALTEKPTLLVEMPIHQAESQVTRAQQHMTFLENRFDCVSCERVELTTSFDTLVQSLPPSGNQALYNLSLANSRARLRMTTLYYFAGIHRYLVAGTGNKIEDFGVGFFTKYGDGGVDLSPIADLTKTEVYSLAESLGVHEDILNAAPTDGLFGDDRSDEDQLGASYPELEWAMNYTENGENLSIRQREVLVIYQKLNRQNQHKMQPIPVCIIPDDLRQ